MKKKITIDPRGVECNLNMTTGEKLIGITISIILTIALMFFASEIVEWIL